MGPLLPVSETRPRLVEITQRALRRQELNGAKQKLDAVARINASLKHEFDDDVRFRVAARRGVTKVVRKPSFRLPHQQMIDRDIVIAHNLVKDPTRPEKWLQEINGIPITREYYTKNEKTVGHLNEYKFAACLVGCVFGVGLLYTLPLLIYRAYKKRTRHYVRISFNW